MKNPKAEEKKFHNDEVRFNKNRKWIESLKPNLVLWPIRFGWNLLKDRRYDKMLDFGCGYGLSIDALSANSPKILVGIDLSIARTRECIRRFPKSSNKFLVGDCESLCFKSNSFDCIFGNAILHHITLTKAMSEINRSLKNGGKAVFIEPLGHNPFISLFRKLTPRARTKNEKPLLIKNITEIEKMISGKVHVYYFFLSILPLLPMYGFANEDFRSRLISFANSIDKSIFTFFPYLRRFAWVAVIEIVKEPVFT
jgi:ubiquinone/menaquinone biosynthesis C-methylase UbiE